MDKVKNENKLIQFCYSWEYKHYPENAYSYVNHMAP